MAGSFSWALFLGGHNNNLCLVVFFFHVSWWLIGYVLTFYIGLIVTSHLCWRIVGSAPPSFREWTPVVYLLCPWNEISLTKNNKNPFFCRAVWASSRTTVLLFEEKFQKTLLVTSLNIFWLIETEIKLKYSRRKGNRKKTEQPCNHGRILFEACHLQSVFLSH